jgi:hypothetical protein
MANKIDSTGAAIGGVRIDPAKAYSPIPQLLQRYINEGDEKAWREIVQRIDYIYAGIGKSLTALDKETGFSREVKARVEQGQNLLFKPNLVNPSSIEPVTRGPGPIATMTPWSFIAALMRWFHDELGVTFHQMSVGEASTTMSAVAGAYSLMRKGKGVVTTQAVMEGRCGDFYGGWGFYFARLYLAETHARGHNDDPMRGYEESLAGVCLPPGKAPDRLLVYDINKIDDDMSNGREAPVPGGVNFKSIILHKAVIGGDPAIAADRKNWPGCVLINVPKLKCHVLELFTNAIKNLGIGLYPMEVNGRREPGKLKWLYANPYNKPVPGMKSLIPHQPWSPVYDEKTGAPLLDENGRVRMRKTGGMAATMADVLSLVKSQDIYMLHVIDAIEATNGGQAGPTCVAMPEGYVFASRDPVALDVQCARYLFTNVPVAEARKAQKEQDLPTDFLQKVPLPRPEGKNIITAYGYDSPIPRYHAFQYCQDRGIGQQNYYLVGQDVWQGGRLASIEGHLGRVDGDRFTELLTGNLYYATGKMLHDLQATTLAYASANDELTGSNYHDSLLAELDENGDGVIDYSEKGKSGGTGIDFGALSVRMQALDVDTLESLKLRFLLVAQPLRSLRGEWNKHGINMGKRVELAMAIPIALRLSQLPSEMPDPLVPGMTFGKGKWPSIQYVTAFSMFARVYGPGFPSQFDLLAVPYGLAFRYAALKWGNGEFKGLETPASANGMIAKYHQAVNGGVKELPFTLYVPVGLGKANGHAIPNVIETADPRLIFTAEFEGGKEVWRELDYAGIP